MGSGVISVVDRASGIPVSEPHREVEPRGSHFRATRGATVQDQSYRICLDLSALSSLCRAAVSGPLFASPEWVECGHLCVNESNRRPLASAADSRITRK
jgi:hypothetical protein